MIDTALCQVLNDYEIIHNAFGRDHICAPRVGI